MRPRFLLSFFLLAQLAACAHQPPAADQKGDQAMAETQPGDNPFFEQWTTPFGVPPFDQIEDGHFLPAFEEGIRRHKVEVRAIADSAEPASFDNTPAALDRSGELLRQVVLVFFGLNNAHTNDRLDEVAKKVAPMLSGHKDDILLDEKLFARVQAVCQKRDALSLTPEQRTLLEETHQDFVRGGATLDPDDKATLRKINGELSLLQVQFGQNVLKEDNAFRLVIEDRVDLAGLPEAVIQAAAKAAAERGHQDKWVFTLHKPSLIPFLQYADQRELRKKMLQAYTSRGAHGDERDNREILKKIVALRTRKAHLLGYQTYAAYLLQRRMARTPAAVYELIGKIWKAALPVARREAAALQALIDKEGGGFKLAPWDWWYYAEKLRKSEYDLDENELRPYLKLENVLAGAFEVATRLYGLQFVPRSDLPVYHPDVKTFEVQEVDGRHLGVLYVDYFPRASKRGGAWCGGFREQTQRDGERIAPIITNVGNFTRPTADKPSLLSFEEVETLFHEFGHALHMLMADKTYNASGDNIKVDFVELPSQIMENWASEAEVLKLYARHHQTGEPIPDALIAKIEKSKHFNQGFATVEYLAACFLDMDWHMIEEIEADGMDVAAFEKAALDKIGLIPEIVVRYRSPYFQHIFRSDFYAAGYYSYIWSAVLDADAFEAFKDKGLFDQKTARAFRELLSKGGAEDPAILYKRFRGAEPRIEPLLKRRGMLEAGD